jgi:hypothetical protein
LTLALPAWFLHPVAPIAVIVGVIGLRNRDKISTPLLRVLALLSASSVLALNAANVAQGPLAGLVGPAVAAAVFSLTTTTAYLVRPWNKK